MLRILIVELSIAFNQIEPQEVDLFPRNQGEFQIFQSNKKKKKEKPLLPFAAGRLDFTLEVCSTSVWSIYTVGWCVGLETKQELI